MKYLLGIIIGVVFVAVLFGAYSLKIAPPPAGSVAMPVPVAADAPPLTMRRYVSDSFGFSIDLPEQWITLDEGGFRKLLSQYQNVTDERALETSVNTLVIGAIEDWPVDRSVPALVINHHPSKRREVKEILETVVKFKKASLDSVDVLVAPTDGALGGFRGAYIRTRDRMSTSIGTFEEESVLWVLWVSNGYMMITANAPTGDAAGMRAIEDMLASFRDTVGG